MQKKSLSSMIFVHLVLLMLAYSYLEIQWNLCYLA